MNEWLKRVFEQIKTLWNKWGNLQKIIFFSIIAVALGGVVLLTMFSSTPSMVPLINTRITDEDLLQKITLRLDKEGVQSEITPDGRILVKDSKTARRMVTILIREDLLPKDVSPWDVFKLDRWTLTDFERNVNLRQAITRSLEQHIEALDDVDNAQVVLVIPEEKLLAANQDAVTASIVITPRPGSDITENRAKIDGIVKLIQLAVQGLQQDNIVILDNHGKQLNDSDALAAIDKLTLTKKQLKLKTDMETQYETRISKALERLFPDRFALMKIELDLDFGERTINKQEYLPTILVHDDPKTPYSEEKVVESIVLSKSDNSESFKGTGFNPKGPAGNEGQTPPDYKDLSNLTGQYERASNTENMAISKQNTHETATPWEIKRISVAVAVDGIWIRKYGKTGQVLLNEDGSIQREYEPVSDEDLSKAEDLVKKAIGFMSERGDTVSVKNIQFDRRAEQQQENEKFRNQLRLRQTLFWAALIVAFALLLFLGIRLVSRYLEKQRRLREEELARQHQAMREAALRSAEEEGMEVSMSVEERARLEMQEGAINMAREHPEDVAQLIRTWLMEE